MKQFFWSLIIICTIVSCKLSNSNPTGEANKELVTLFSNYYKERLELFPLESTQNGDSILNDKMYIDFTESYRNKLKAFYSKHLAYVKSFDREYLNANDKISFDIFKREMEMSI